MQERLSGFPRVDDTKAGPPLGSRAEGGAASVDTLAAGGENFATTGKKHLKIAENNHKLQSTTCKSKRQHVIFEVSAAIFRL